MLSHPSVCIIGSHGAIRLSQTIINSLRNIIIFIILYLNVPACMHIEPSAVRFNTTIVDVGIPPGLL